MTDKQFKRLNEICCKNWLNLTAKERLDFCLGDGAFGFIEQTADMLYIKLSKKDYGVDVEQLADATCKSRIDTIADNMLAVEVAVYGGASLVEDGAQVEITYPKYYFDLRPGTLTDKGRDVVNQYATKTIPLTDGIRIVADRNAFMSIFFELTNKDYDKQMALMDLLKEYKEAK